VGINSAAAPTLGHGSLHNLVGHVIWKINCRADAVVVTLFRHLRDAGLYVVYMGLGICSEEGLEIPSKTPEPSQRRSTSSA
jgi:hypothetical protein